MRVTLVAPPANYLSELYGLQTRRSYRNQLPLGIGYIASTLIREGLEVSLLDACAQGWGVERTAREVCATRPDVVGISAITFEAASAYALIRRLKAERETAFVVLGGAHANSHHPMIPEECPEVDAVGAGDGEVIMAELCRRVGEGRPLEGMLGVSAKGPEGTFSPLKPHPPVPDLDALPYPAYHLYRHPLYKPLPHRAKRLPSTCMITSRGCSYAKCTYCELSGLIRKTFRRHSPERVVEELETLIAVSKAREVYFQDDIFISDPEWVEDFCRRLTKSDLDILWSCESRFQGVSKGLLERMGASGCWRIYYGFESGNQRLLDRIEKGFALKEAREAAAKANAAGMDVVGLFMIGLPGETPEEAEETIAFSIDLGLDHAFFSLTVPRPTTELYRICKEAGSFVDGNEYYYKKASFVPTAYKSVDQLEAMRDRAFRRFYFRPAYWWRCLCKIRSLEDLLYYLRGFISFVRYARQG